MKTKLFTKNAYVAMLMALVLAFSVQGNLADALTLSATSGDFDNANVNVPFSITFGAVLVGTNSAGDLKNANYTEVPSANVPASQTDTPYYYIDTGDAGYQNEGRVSNSAAKYNNNEAATISVSGATITHIGSTATSSTALTRATSSHTLKEDPYGTGVDQLETSVTVWCLASRAGKVTITVSDATPSEDLRSTDRRSARLDFTIYVVKDPLSVGTSDTISLLGVTNGVGYPYDHLNDLQIYRGDSRYNRVTYALAAGNAGTLYVKEGNRAGKFTAAGTNLVTSSNAPVYLSMGTKTTLTGRPSAGSTNTVTATVNDSDTDPTTGIYIYRRPQLSDPNPTPVPALRMGRPGLRVPNAITVNVDDGAGNDVGGVPVTFEVTDTSSSGGLLSYPTATLDNLKIDNRNQVLENPPAAASTLHVRTNGSGDAIVDFEFGSAGGEQVITVKAVGITKTVKALDTATSTRDVSIRSEKRSNSNKHDIYATVTDNKIETAGVDVTFTTISGGELTNTPTDPTDANTPPENGEDEVTDRTNSLGIAHAIYDPLGASGTLQISVSLKETGTPGDATADTIRRTFNVTGGSAPPPPPTGATDTITLTLSSTTGAPGDEIDVEVDSSPRGVLVNIDSGELADADFSRLSGGTPFTSRLTLPDEADRYTFSARRSGFTSDSATVTVGSADAGATGARIEIDVTGTGTTRTVTITALNAQGGNVPGLDVTLRGSALIGGAQTVRVGTPTSITVTTGTLEAAALGFVTAEEPITVGAGSAPGDPSGTGTLTVQKDGGQIGTQQTLLVTASPVPSSSVDFTVTRGGVTVGSGTILTTGSGRGIVTVPTTGLYVLTVRAPGYASEQVTFTAGEQSQQPQQQQPQQQQPQQQQPTVSEPSSITISGLSAHSGTVNQPLDAPLAVRVLDANGAGVANARVIFRVVGQGQGRLSQRGNGLAIPKETDRNGFARADFTPLGAGIITVEAEARGVMERVTFTITTGSVPPAPGDPTPSTTTTVSPVVNAGVSAASRPPMLWISGGKIYALVGSDVKAFISTVDNAISLAVGGGRVYWTAKTSDTHGTLNSANVDGTDAKELRILWGVPRGITVDVANSKLYWVDAANRLQSSNLDGSGIENVIRNLSDPKDVAVSGGNAYWVGNGAGTDTLVFINLSDPKKEIHPIAATSGIYGGLTIANGKLYWTEQVSDTHGTLNAANLDGTQVKELRDEPIWGAPIGIAVDTARSRLYWTDAAGRLQRSNLDGSGIHNVAKGLGTPADMVLSNSIMEPAETPSTTTPTASTSKYDINEDGTVDSKDVDVLIVAVLAELTDDKYDVNADGKVNVADVKAVNANLDAGAAGAPTLLGMKFTAIERDRLQEQIDLLVASGDRSPAALKTLIYLQQLLVMARPEKTQLLANYPNPFNPETWIPYELATDTDVRITIYNAQGVVIRTLQLGQQSAGYYTDRERAAYWDGRNALGEQVASGIYFYQLETDTLSSLRKMVILK